MKNIKEIMSAWKGKNGAPARKVEKKESASHEKREGVPGMMKARAQMKQMRSDTMPKGCK